MKYFTDVAALYEGSNRTVHALASQYDLSTLTKSVQSLMSQRLEKSEILGKRVLLKPNWVRHNRQSKEADDKLCLRTHDAVVLSVLETVLQQGPEKVTIGDAPIQGCRWELVVRPEFTERIQMLSKRHQVPVEIRDFRRVTFDPQNNELTTDRNPISDYLIFDLGSSSYLEPITRGQHHRFRVTDYDPDRLVESHAPGIHKYCITRELFDSDVVISLPKVKTHQKAGITNALKNVVGVNGDKDFLPHHRKGGTSHGGDCYPGGNYLRKWSEDVLDHANRRRGRPSYMMLRRLSSLLWKLSLPGPEHSLAAAWHGNDTTWRMVLDLNQIVEYGKSDGTLSNTKQRVLYSLCDGIIAGQGDGPLNPEPLELGILAFSNHSVATDVVVAKLMGLDHSRIPLLASQSHRIEQDGVEIRFNGQATTISALSEHAIVTKLPPGWISMLLDPKKES